jgi:tricorn protease
MRRTLLPLVLLSLLLLGGSTQAADPATAEPNRDDMRLLRMPDIHGDTIVFVYAGDLWTVPAAGGEARRLTSHVGEETFPNFSPDGRHIAFSGDYDGNRDVFVIPAEGGVPERLTWHPARDRVIDWQPDGRSVRFQSLRTKHDGSDLQLWTVPLAGGLPQKMILPEGGLSGYSPDGRRLAYNRRTREFRTWKRYKGGWAQDIWIFNFASNKAERVTDWVGTDSFPMWYGDTIYFTSDRTGRLQIWALDPTTGEQRQVTRHEEYDVKFPSLGPDAIVYENGGWLWVLDLPGEQTRRMKVTLHDDFVLTRSAIKTVDDLISGGDVAPDAKRAVFAARGDIFTVPAEKGNVRNLTASSGVRERAPAWSPDGHWIAYFGDGTGEYEIYLRPGNGRGEERRLTKGIQSYLTGMSWSPDSRKILFSAADLTLSCIEAESGKLSRIARSPADDITDYAWSPDSRWVAYAMTEENDYASIFLYDTKTEQTTRITTDFTNDTDPAFDPEGKYLYFASARNWQPVYGNVEFRPLWTQQDGLYLVMLQKDQALPFPPESDEVEVKEEGEKEKKQDEGKDTKAGKKKDKHDQAAEDKDQPPETVIDLAGIEQRIVALPIESGNYRNLRAAKGKLFYQNRPLRPGSKAGPALMVFVMEDREA